MYDLNTVADSYSNSMCGAFIMDVDGVRFLCTGSRCLENCPNPSCYFREDGSFIPLDQLTDGRTCPPHSHCCCGD